MSQVQLPPPPPMMGSATPPAPQTDAERGKSVVKKIVMWLLVAFLFLIVLPIMALMLLGTTVADEIAAEYPLESAVSPTGEAYINGANELSMTVPNDWAEPFGQETNGIDLSVFMIPELATDDFRANVIAWNADVLPSATLAQIATAELETSRRQGIDISYDSEQNRNLGGTLVRETVSTMTYEGLDLRTFSIIHKNDDAYAMAVLTTTAADFEQAIAEYEEHLLTIRALD